MGMTSSTPPTCPEGDNQCNTPVCDTYLNLINIKPLLPIASIPVPEKAQTKRRVPSRVTTKTFTAVFSAENSCLILEILGLGNNSRFRQQYLVFGYYLMLGY